MSLLKHLNDQGTTIIQVTHNEKYAAYGDRIINLLDGWVVEGEDVPAGAASEVDQLA